MGRGIPSTPRRHDVDALRVLATILVIVFHVGMVFNPAPFYHVRNDASSIVLLVVCGFLSLWMMPLFFVLAGWSAFGSVRRHGAGPFLGRRVRKLLVPLAVGVALFGPALKYVELRGGQDLNHRGLHVAPELQESFRGVVEQPLPEMAPFEEGFLEFWPSFFTRLDRFTWAHLWFLAYLFVLSAAALPWLRWLSARPDGGTDSWRAAWAYAPLVPLVLIEHTLRPLFPGVYNLYADWANVLAYGTYLVAGFALARWPALEEVVHAETGRAATVAAVALLVLLGTVVGVVQEPRVVLTAVPVAGWCSIVTLLGLARRRLGRPGSWLVRRRELAFPGYVVHQIVVVGLGAAIVAWSPDVPSWLDVLVKLPLLLVGSLLGTWAAVRYLVLPFGPVRVAFGLTSPRPAPLPATVRGTIAGALVVVATSTVAAPDTVGTAADPVGLWWAEGGAAQVEVREEAGELSGRVVWLRSPLGEDGCPLLDTRNPDASRRDREVVGLRILSGLRRDERRLATWSGGEIYDPTSGRTYRARLQLESPDRMSVRGFLGVRLLGRTATWHRVVESTGCRSAPER